MYELKTKSENVVLFRVEKDLKSCSYFLLNNTSYLKQIKKSWTETKKIKFFLINLALIFEGDVK